MEAAGSEPAREHWTGKKVVLFVANVACVIYLASLVVLPKLNPSGSSLTTTGGGAPTTSSQPSDMPPETPEPIQVEEGPYTPVTKPLESASEEQLQRFRKLGMRQPTSTFPREEWMSVTSEALIAQRSIKLYSVLPCIGDDDSAPPFEVAFLPIGCFGDFVDRFPCQSTTCVLARSLANATFCGKSKFGAFLGDNFYPNGLKRADDRRFEKDLNAKFFRFPALRMTYYAMVGNHDLRPHTQLRQPGEHPYWVMPAYKYAAPVVGEGKVTVQSFIVDTHWGFDHSYPFLAEQGKWLDEELTKSTARWKIVMSHEPVFCFKGFGNNRGLVDFIHPVLKKHKVRLFVAAHVHGISLAKVEGGYYQLVSAGFADNVHRDVKLKRPRGYYHMGRGGTAVLFGENEAVVVAFSATGDLIFSHAIPLTGNTTVETTRGVQGGTDNLWKGTR